jgi:hypothetical protein
MVTGEKRRERVEGLREGRDRVVGEFKSGVRRGDGEQREEKRQRGEGTERRHRSLERV